MCVHSTGSRIEKKKKNFLNPERERQRVHETLNIKSVCLNKCDLIWQNFTTLPKSLKFSASFLRVYFVFDLLLNLF